MSSFCYAKINKCPQGHLLILILTLVNLSEADLSLNARKGIC